ncbi:MAG TPA: site-2 protease family protein [Candidatus Polarisedimenticolaceae bacterium]|nr:site-2 protease family protein [Candidatus Polarisedimenticolaceae bacterium]
MDAELIRLLPLWYVVFLLSITCHEAAHAWVAYRGGDETAYLGGQVSLNPMPHVVREPFGTVLVPLISYFLFSSTSGRWMIGWASAPYDPYWEDRHPKRAALMSAAGPAANLLLAVIGFVGLKVGLARGLWEIPGADLAFDRLVAQPVGLRDGSAWVGLGRFCSVLFSLNLILCVFNLLPIPPMDGASVVSGISEPARRLRHRLGGSPLFGLVGLLVAWNVFPYLFYPIYRVALGWLYG